MKCRLEEKSYIFNILSALGKGYETGNFNNFFPFLAKFCFIRSQTKPILHIKPDAVKNYFIEKGKEISQSETPYEYHIIELIEKYNQPKDNSEKNNVSYSLEYTPKKLGLYINEIYNEANFFIIDIQLDANYMVEKIKICNPRLFDYNDFSEFVEFLPAYNYKENKAALIRINSLYYNELYLFFKCIGKKFDEYDDLHVPMNDWCAILSYWKKFIEANSFDNAFETLADVDYTNNTVSKPDIAKFIGRIGKEIWDKKQESRTLLNELIEWTELYKSSYNYIDTYGW